MSTIKQVFARQILNAKGIPTVECTVILDDGKYAVSSSPSGTSVSGYEAKELRDEDPTQYNGLGVLRAVSNVINVIGPKIIGMDPVHQNDIDRTMIELDGTPDKNNLGANAILSVSQAVAKAGAKSLNMQLYSYLRHFTSIQGAPFKIPTPAFNILNGGKHAGNNLDFQEFLIIPASSIPYPQTLNMAAMIYHSLKETLRNKGATTLIGDEGGFGPSFATNRDALVMLHEAISASTFKLNYEVFFGIDASANNFKSEGGNYSIKDKGNSVSSSDLVGVYESLNEQYNLLYLEDPFGEDDWDGWEQLNQLASKNTLIVGDDLTATNVNRLQEAIKKKAIGGIIIKPNQAGTVIETLGVVEVAREAGLKLIASHRSGDTDDDFIADFAVAIGADYVKFGAPARGERVAKYNRLSEIYNQINGS